MDYDESSLDKLWREFKCSPTKANKHRLIECYLPWCRKIASSLLLKYRNPLCEWDDYLSIATVEMIKSIDTFDTMKNVDFEAYIYPRVRGAIIDFVNKMSVKSLPSEKAYEYCFPSSSNSLDESFSLLFEAAVGLAFGFFLQAGVRNDSNEDTSLELAYQKDEEYDKVLQLVKRLSAQQQLVIKLHYFQYLSFTEIAQHLDITKSRVSQLHAQAIKNIRNHYQSELSGE